MPKGYQEQVLERLTEIAEAAGLTVTVEYEWANVGKLRAGSLTETVVYLDFNFQSGGKNMFLLNGQKHGPETDLNFYLASTDGEGMARMLASWTRHVGGAPKPVRHSNPLVQEALNNEGAADYLESLHSLDSSDFIDCARQDYGDAVVDEAIEILTDMTKGS